METNSRSGSDFSGGGTECSVVGVLRGTNDIDLNSYKECGQTVLHVLAACSSGYLVRHLLMLGASPNVQDNEGCTPLHVAIGACADDVFTVSASWA